MKSGSPTVAIAPTDGAPCWPATGVKLPPIAGHTFARRCRSRQPCWQPLATRGCGARPPHVQLLAAPPAGAQVTARDRPRSSPSRSVLVMHLPRRLMHDDARVGRQDVEKWPTVWRHSPPARRLSPARRLEDIHEIINLPLWFLRTAYQLSISCCGVEQPAAIRPAAVARPTLGIVHDARREQPKRVLIKL